MENAINFSPFFFSFCIFNFIYANYYLSVFSSDFYYLFAFGTATAAATTSFHLLCNILLWILYEYMKFIKRDTFRNDKRYWRNFTNGNFPLCYFHHLRNVLPFRSLSHFSFIFYWMTHNVAALYEFIWIVADENSIFFLLLKHQRQMVNRNKEKGNLGPENWLSREEIQLFFSPSEFLIASI